MIVLFWISKQGIIKKKDEGILIRPSPGIDKESIF